MYKKNFFSRVAKKVSHALGSPIAFCGAALIIVVWGVSGPLFNFSDTWQLVINTSTTIITFLMVFLIQNTQNRDSEAIQIKLDELIRSVQGAHNALLDLEELSDDEIKKIHAFYRQIAKQAKNNLKKGLSDGDNPEIPTMEIKD